MSKIESINVLVKGDKEGQLTLVAKIVLAAYRNVRKIIGKINEKFFTSIKYDTSNKIFNISSLNYSKLVEALQSLNDEVTTTYDNYGVMHYSNSRLNHIINLNWILTNT